MIPNAPDVDAVEYARAWVDKLLLEPGYRLGTCARTSGSPPVTRTACLM